MAVVVGLTRLGEEAVTTIIAGASDFSVPG
jgi:hypothetical protein